MSQPKFVQVEREFIRAMKELGLPAVTVYHVLCDHCWGKWGEKRLTWPTVATMATETGYKRSTVFKALNTLRQEKWIEQSGLYAENGAVKWTLLRRSPAWKGAKNDTSVKDGGVHGRGRVQDGGVSEHGRGSSTAVDGEVQGRGPKSDESQTKIQTSSTKSGGKRTEADQRIGNSPSEADTAEVAKTMKRWRDTHRPSQTTNWNWNDTKAQ